jgi:hypothetical protein
MELDGGCPGSVALDSQFGRVVPKKIGEKTGPRGTSTSKLIAKSVLTLVTRYSAQMYLLFSYFYDRSLSCALLESFIKCPAVQSSRCQLSMTPLLRPVAKQCCAVRVRREDAGLILGLRGLSSDRHC